MAIVKKITPGFISLVGEILDFSDFLSSYKNHINNFPKFTVSFLMQIFVFERKNVTEDIERSRADSQMIEELSSLTAIRDKINFRARSRLDIYKMISAIFPQKEEIHHVIRGNASRIDSHVYVARRQTRSIGLELPYRQSLARGVISRNCIVPHRSSDNCHR